MAQILIRNLPDNVKQSLKKRALARGVSLEAEARDILRHAAGQPASQPNPKSAGIASRLAREFAKTPIPDDAWEEFEKNLRDVRHNARMRKVDLGE